MREFMTRVEIAAGPEQVWKVMADIERWPEWTESMRRIERLDQAPLGVGSRARVEQPRLRPTVWTITDWNPGNGFVWVSRSPGLRTRAEHLIEPTDKGTRVTLIVKFDGLLASAVGYLGGGLTRRYLELEANGLKRRSEGTT